MNLLKMASQETIQDSFKGLHMKNLDILREVTLQGNLDQPKKVISPNANQTKIFQKQGQYLMKSIEVKPPGQSLDSVKPTLAFDARHSLAELIGG
jgi:hypothetical protein